MELARAEEVEDAVEVARLAVEAVLVEVGVVAVAQLHHLAARAARAQLAEPRLRQPLEEAPGGLQREEEEKGERSITRLRIFCKDVTRAGKMYPSVIPRGKITVCTGCVATYGLTSN